MRPRTMQSDMDASGRQFPRLGDDDGVPALLVDGVVQSVLVRPGREVGGYWVEMLPSVRPRRALLLGLGGGTVAQLLQRRFGPLPIVGVEADPAVVELARSALGLELPGLEIRLGDAFDYLETCRERFDYIGVDLFRGGQLERAVLSRPVLRRLRAVAEPGAEIFVNLFADRTLERSLRRIGRVLTVRETRRVGRNAVARLGLR